MTEAGLAVEFGGDGLLEGIKDVLNIGGGGPCSSGQLQELGVEHGILHCSGVGIKQQPNVTGKAPLGQDVALYLSKHQATGGLQLPLRSKGESPAAIRSALTKA